MAEARSQAWTALVSRLSLPQRSLGKDILDPAVVPDWSTIESYGNKWEIPSSNTTAGRQAIVMSTSEDRAYFIGVTQDRVVTLWGLRELPELNEDGGQYAAFLGDFREVAGVSTPPPLVTLPNIASRQAFKHGVFITSEVPVLPHDAFATEVAADDFRYAGRAQDEEGGEAAVVTVVPRLLHVHPVFAALHLQARTPKDAFVLSTQLQETMTDEQVARHRLYFNFIKAAATRADGEGDPVSSLATEWNHLPLTPGSALEQRYFQIVARAMPTNPALRAVNASRTANHNSEGPGTPNLTDADDSPRGEKKKQYAAHEIRRILSMSGIIIQDESLDDLPELLPDFWVGFLTQRKSNHAARNYVQAQWSCRVSTERIGTPFFMSARLIQDLRALDFGGQDVGPTYSLRGRGLSLYTLGPLELFQSPDLAAEEESMRLVEQTELDGNLTLDERRSNVKAAEKCSSTPKDRHNMIIHLECVQDRFQFLFGMECPVIPYLRKWIQLIGSQPVFQSWRAPDWVALYWAMHRAIRQVTNNCDTAIGNAQLLFMGGVNEDLQKGRSFTTAGLPQELLQMVNSNKRPREHDDRKKGPAKDPAAGGVNPSQPKKARPERTHPLAKILGPLVHKGRQAYKGRDRLSLGRILGKDGVRQILGEDFCSLAKPSGKPCSYMYFGKCNSTGCIYDHELSAEPDQVMKDGIVARLTKRIDDFIAEQPKD